MLCDKQIFVALDQAAVHVLSSFSTHALIGPEIKGSSSCEIYSVGALLIWIRGSSCKISLMV